jgi:hypothetical protein
LLFDHSNCRDLKRDVPEGYTALGFRDRNDVESVLVSHRSLIIVILLFCFNLNCLMYSYQQTII